jgi:hypothetical protein
MVKPAGIHGEVSENTPPCIWWVLHHLFLNTSLSVLEYFTVYFQILANGYSVYWLTDIVDTGAGRYSSIPVGKPQT